MSKIIDSSDSIRFPRRCYLSVLTAFFTCSTIMFFSMQRMRSRTDTRCFKLSRSLLRVSRQAQVSHVSPLPASASLYRRRRFNTQRVRQEILSPRRFYPFVRPSTTLSNSTLSTAVTTRVWSSLSTPTTKKSDAFSRTLWTYTSKLSLL